MSLALWAGMLAFVTIPAPAAALKISLASDRVDQCTSENQVPIATGAPEDSTPAGLQPIELVTSARAFETSLLSVAQVPPSSSADAPPKVSSANASTPPADGNRSNQPREEMVKWFGIFGFVLLLMRGARRR